jgi:hypothetical protein
MVFRVRTKERLAAANANVCSLRFRVCVLSSEWRLGAFLPRHLKLLFRQLRTPLRIVLLDFLAHVFILHPAGLFHEMRLGGLLAAGSANRNSMAVSYTRAVPLTRSFLRVQQSVADFLGDFCE